MYVYAVFLLTLLIISITYCITLHYMCIKLIRLRIPQFFINVYYI